MDKDKGKRREENTKRGEKEKIIDEEVDTRGKEIGGELDRKEQTVDHTHTHACIHACIHRNTHTRSEYIVISNPHLMMY